MCKEKYCYLSLDFQTIPYLFLKHHIPDIQIKKAQWVLGFMSPSWILQSSRRQTTSLRLHRHKIKHLKSETNFLRVDRWDDWIKKTHSCEKWNVMLHKYHPTIMVDTTHQVCCWFCTPQTTHTSMNIPNENFS